MASTKEYKIVINGLKESVSEVDALNKQLDNLEKRMNALSQKNINVGTTSTPKVDNSALQEQDKLTKDIWATQEKINDARDRDYQELVRLKDELKQAKVEAEGLAAASKLDENNYNLNTMEGIKEKLKDIKREMQTTDIGSDKFKQLTTEANDLNTKLKDIEATYGQFGRNVGNYQSAIQGFEGFKMKIGETEVQFNSLKDAMRSLKNEMGSLEMQNKGNTKEYDQLKQALDEVTKANQRLQSSMKDVENSSKFMDYMLDTMTSFTALASAGKGLSTFFGFDSSKVDESIKKLMALQNALKGLETLKRQMNTNEGFAKIFSSANSAIDAFSTKLFGAKKAVEGTTTAMKTATKASKAFSVALKGLGIGLLISLIVSLTKKWDKINEAINKSIPALEKFGGIMGAIEGAINGVINAMGSMFEILAALIRLDFSEIGNIIAKAFKDGMQEVQDDVAREAAATAAENIKLQMDMLVAQHGEEVKYTKQYQQLLKERNDLLAKSYDESTKEGKKAAAEHKVQMAREEKELKDHAKEMARLQGEADEELTRLRIANMKEGLNKTLTQLEEERKAKLAKIRETGINVAELELETNKEYDKKIEDAEKEFYQRQIEARQAFNERMLQLEIELAKRELDITTNQTQRDAYKANNDDTKDRFTLFKSSYGIGSSILGNSELSEVAIQYANLRAEFDDLAVALEEGKERLKKATVEEAEVMKKNNDAMLASMTELEEKIKTLDNIKGFSGSFEKSLAESGFLQKSIGTVFDQRLKELEDFYGEWNDTTKKFTEGYNQMLFDAAIKAANQRDEVLNKEEEAEIASLRKTYEESYKITDDYYKGLIQTAEAQIKDEKVLKEKKIALEKEFGLKLSDLEADFGSSVLQIQEQYTQKRTENNEQFETDIRKGTSEYYKDLLQEYRDYQTAINTVQAKSPIINSWGIVDIKKTKENNKEVQENISKLINSLVKKKIELDEQYKNGLIDKTVYDSTSREMERQINDAKTSMEEAVDSSRNIIGEFMESIQQYTQAFSQTLSGILEAVWTAQDAAYEREKEQLEKDTEELEEQLDKQKEITEKYKDDINNIESELSTARGDRRQELIDQLNAQKAAQRASLAEEKRIAKEKEKLEQKADKLDKEQKEKQKERDLVTAGINAGMAILGAAANHWPMPAIPLVAAATALGVAQIAKIKAQKYSNGGILGSGVIQGRSHSQGGVKVLGGTAEVEGGEYITNKQTTAKNVELLDFINTKKKRVDLSDMVEFFDGGTRRTIRNISPTMKYAEGGQLPLLNSDITINDRLLNAFEKYSERPTVVSVTEINDVQADVRQVQVLAGAVD